MPPDGVRMRVLFPVPTRAAGRVQLGRRAVWAPRWVSPVPLQTGQRDSRLPVHQDRSLRREPVRIGGDKPPLSYTVFAFNAGSQTQLWRQAH
jgi:hypothetical protein